ncbi:hypothetical protein [Rhodococcus rhodochrous]|uniref:hypothetical protein n=1 Tax=Rhodococcus rhodochrous TaxID=1829 RepID=UPI000E727CA6
MVIELPRSGVGPNVRGQAVAALTAIALSTHNNANQIDSTDELAGIPANATASVGSVERFLIGRPGLWEAGIVAELLDGTVMGEGLPQ